MGRLCEISACSTNEALRRREGNNHYSFFKFPNDSVEREKWLEICGLVGEPISRVPFLCSVHFVESDIYFRGRRPQLKPGVVPKVHQKENVIVIPRNPPPLSVLLPKTQAVRCRSVLQNAAIQASVLRPGCKVEAVISARRVPFSATRQNVPCPLPPLVPLARKSHEDVREPHDSAEGPGHFDTSDTFDSERTFCPSVVPVHHKVVFKQLARLADQQRHSEQNATPAFARSQADAEKEVLRLQKTLFAVTEDKTRLAEDNAKLRKDLRAANEAKAVLEAKVASTLRQYTKKCVENKKLREQVRRMRNEIDRAARKYVVQRRDLQSDYLLIRKASTDDVILALLRRMKGEVVGCYDDPHIRMFALTVHFYSPACYRYLRKKWRNALPCEATLRNWYSVTDSEVGFTEQSFAALKMLAAEKNNNVPVSLMVDDMAIRKKANIDESGLRVIGIRDLGQGNDDIVALKGRTKTDNGREINEPVRPPVATSVCVFMVVCLKQRLKMPVGYFFHDGLNGSQLKMLVSRCMEKLYDVGVTVRALISDGASQNRTMAKMFGADIDPVKYDSTATGMAAIRTLRTHFSHPCNPAIRVFFMLDVCHMMKLVRNALASRHEIHTSDGQVVSWRHIQGLHAVQNGEGLRLGNKLTDNHIEWHRNKQKVSYAAQTFSRSVAISLTFCEILNLPQFKGASATAHFAQTFNDLFDVLNSFSKFSTGHKSPLSLSNENEWSRVLDSARDYIHGLKIRENESHIFESVFLTKRAVGFQGFLVAIESVKGLFDDLVRNGDMDYICTYKLSQDHLESFFGKIRQRRGVCDNNPSAAHFKGSYRRLLLASEVQASKSSNTTPQILNAVETNKAFRAAKILKQERKVEASKRLENNILLDDFVSVGELLAAYGDPRLSSLSRFALAAVSYVGGFVARKVCRAYGECEKCKAALVKASHDTDSGDFDKFIGMKTMANTNGLTIPSKDVVLVCVLTEEAMRRCSPRSVDISNVVKNSATNIESVLREVLSLGGFRSLLNHSHPQGPSGVHLIKNIIIDISKKYHECKMKHTCHLFNAVNMKHALRQKLTKLIHHNNQ